MANLVLVNSFTTKLTNGVFNFGSHTFNVFLSNVAPNVATMAVKADVTEISAGNGYTALGQATACTKSNASGVETIFFVDKTWTASGGAISQFRYVWLYDVTTGDLIGYYDYGSAVTPAVGESFTTDFDGTNGVFSVG